MDIDDNKSHEGTKRCHSRRDGARVNDGFLRLRVFVSSWLIVIVGLSIALAAAEFTPARLVSGGVPMPPPNTVGWGWVFWDLTVDATGHITGYAPFYSTRPFHEVLWKALVGWSFEPAHDGRQPVESHVLVAACYRPAALSTGPDSQPPSVTARPNVPTPITMVPPAYPPTALGDGVVMVELRVDATGRAAYERIVQSAGAFDRPALDAARRWRFRPAERAGVAVPAFVYLVFGFRQPVTES